MGPLQGLKVIELAGIGPGPMAAMLLADMGATVLRVDRKEPASLGVPRPLKYDLLLRNRRSLPLDLKQPAAVQLVLDMVSRSDVLIEGFRPGVTERMGLGPETCLARNPGLIYGRITGWGQTGPMAQDVGHDLNYIALTGALHAFGRAGQPPAPPINLVGDFGGGTLYLVMGVLAALYERHVSGKGQVVDAAMVDGVASLMTQPHGSFAAGVISTERGTNPTDSGAPFYDAYACSDGLWVSLAAVETKFYAQALQVLQLPELLADQWKRQSWPAAKARIAERFASRSRAQWCEAFEGVEACFAPVLTLEEAPQHPHLKERGVYAEIDGVTQPMPAPRFSRTPSSRPEPFKPWSKDEAREILGPWLDDAAIDAARKAQVID
ncbi:MAG: CaiB/BaiF CoA-transferase family protein [Betaproteobacteria bacterium]